jgi:hypothetical protein
MFLHKVVTLSGYWIVVAPHIFDTNCYSYSLSEDLKYGGPGSGMPSLKNCENVSKMSLFLNLGVKNMWLHPYRCRTPSP